MNDAVLFSPSIDRPPSRDGFLSEAVAGLSRPQKTLPCKFLYDEAYASKQSDWTYDT
jgi:hypothetical protein